MITFERIFRSLLLTFLAKKALFLMFFNAYQLCNYLSYTISWVKYKSLSINGKHFSYTFDFNNSRNYRISSCKLICACKFIIKNIWSRWYRNNYKCKCALWFIDCRNTFLGKKLNLLNKNLFLNIIIIDPIRFGWFLIKHDNYKL